MSENTIKSSWRGFPNIQWLIIFGDSYSDVGYRAGLSLPPTEEQPLGVEFPGFTYAETDTPNWVGHLITNHVNHGPILVLDYAVGGALVDGVCRQVQTNFLPRAGTRPTWANWNSSNTLFITWVGINDCAFLQFDSDPMAQPSVKKLFEAQECLYKEGARNFLFIDLPPIHLTPAGYARSDGNRNVGSDIYMAWNKSLKEAIAQFATDHPDITIFLFSSWATFSRVLSDPVSHGFEADDAHKRNGNIWVDHLHPTSAMHDWIARDLSEFLDVQPPYKEPTEQTES